MTVIPPPPTISVPSILTKAKTAYTLWLKILINFPKIHRYTLGAKVDNYFLELLEIIFIALYLPIDQKSSHLTLAISKLDGIKFFLQLSWENKCLPNEKYTEISILLEEIGRILGGWKKGLQAKTPLK